MLYFSSKPVAPESIDREQYKALKRFEQEMKSRALTEAYSSLAGFEDKFRRQLHITVSKEFESSGKSRAAEAQAQEVIPLTDEARKLLIEGSQDKHGYILVLRTMGGTRVQTNQKEFGEMGNPRSETQWTGAVEELEEEGLIKDTSYKGEAFQLTRSGYEVADRLRMELSES